MGTIRELLAKKRRALTMGILNVTPDSFYPESRAPALEQARDQAHAMVEAGADLLDVGGESTRPGSEPVSPEDEADRVLPVLQALADAVDVPISVDTRRASVADQALDAGASIINDVSAGRDDPRMFDVVAEHGADLVLMHMQGDPATMQADPTYEDVVSEVAGFLLNRAAAARQAGVPRKALTIDPGIGFGKRLEHNLALLAGTSTLAGLGYPLLIGVSRKSMFDQLLDRPVDQRLAGSLSVATHCAAQGASVLRVHDIAETRDAVLTVDALQGARRDPS